MKLLIPIFLLCCSGAFAQTLLTLDLENSPVREMIDKIELESDYRFYYRPSDIDSVFITLKVSSQSIPNILRAGLQSTLINYAFTGRSIILSKDVEIRTQLPLGFYDRGSSAPIGLDIAALNFSTENEKTSEEESVEDQLIEIGKRISLQEGKRINLAGSIREELTGEALIGAIVYIEEPRIGVSTDAFGYYNIQLPQGRHTLKIRSIGMKETSRQIMLFSTGTLDIEMDQDVIGLKEVIVEAERSVNILGVQMGIEKISMSDVRQVPTVLGEMDIVKIALTLPGVQSVGEGASGFNVRGGAADQNLVLMNDATLYNPSHFFGFFSVFNPDIVKSATLLKGGIPAQYGGRISSIFDVKTREGNKKKFSARGGISPVTLRLTLEGPIFSDKTSFIIGARSTYSDWLMHQVSDVNIKNSSASFYDVNAKITHDFSDKDALYVSGYVSKDNFRLFSDSLYQYQNYNATVQWKHNFSNKLIAVFSGNYSNYQYEISQKKDSLNAFAMFYSLGSVNAKLDFTYFPSSAHVIDFGISSILYNLEPGTLTSESNFSQVDPITLESERGIESAIYIGDNFSISENLAIYGGLRYSFYRFLGPKTVYTYPDGVPKNPTNTLGSTTYGENETIATYHGPELRASLRYSLDQSSSLKIGYNRMRQYIHMITNTAAISPTDTWKLSDTHIQPQIGDQVSVGYYKNLKENSIETSVEVFYKKVMDIIEYKGGAQLLLNEQLETDLVNGRNKSYGIEFLIRKKRGKFNGWVSYTYSRSLNQVQGVSTDETINDGEYFPSNYDKPHSLNVIANYKFNRRFSISTNLLYSTGRPITYPVARYQLGNSERIFYSRRNEFRIPDYFRVDLSFQIEGNHKVDKPAHSSWSISVYNLLSRNNVYSIYFVSEEGHVQGYKLSIFGSAIPSVTYNFKF